ncbi:MAG: acetylornithine/succinylornithine family transaminase [Clostridia bacterium]|nr:acetylornithine/succinylornithine family transaminase [Clostridia bacterium]
MKLQSLDNTYVASTYRRFPVSLITGKGAVAKDENGKSYIDLTSGIAVNTFGYCDTVWAQAVSHQLECIQHTSNLYYTEPCVTLAQMLCKRTGMHKVFFSNSGAEANECAIKVARKWASENKGPEFATIVTLRNSFHGRTLTTLAATGQDHYHELYQPLTPGFVSVDAEDLAQLEHVLSSQPVAGVLVECIQGEGGVIVLSEDYLKGVEQLCREYQVLLMIDEVQTGNGRTGALYSYMHYGLSPDIVSTAKGLGGGLPLGATLLSERVEHVLSYGDHGSTFGGNPVCCAGAVSILKRLTPHLLDTVSEKGQLAKTILEKCPGVESVTGLGLMIGIKTVKPAGEIASACLQNGVLVLTAKDRVRLLPPLNITKAQLSNALQVLTSVIQS